MNRFKSALILLFTVLLVTVGALLPSAVSYIFDEMMIGESGSKAVRSVQLNNDGYETGNTEDELFRKLALYKSMNSVPVTEDAMDMTEEEAYTATVKLLQEFYSADIIPDFDVSYYSAEQYIALDPDNVDNYFCFWSVNLVSETDSYHNFLIHIDDETGTALYVNYTTNAEAFDGTDDYALLNRFAEIYFTQLGIPQRRLRQLEPANDYSAVNGTIERDESILQLQYLVYGNDLSNSIVIDFYINLQGSLEMVFSE